MKLLVLGTSDSDGSTLSSPDLAWPWLIASEFRSDSSQCLVKHMRFYATAPGALDYVDRQLREADPDVVVLSVTLYAFSVRTVANHVRRLAGPRAGDWTAATVRRFDRATGAGQRGPGADRGWLQRLNHLAHRGARWTIGTASEASANTVWRAYEAAIERLARDEDRRVVVIGSMPFTAAIECENGRARQVQLTFNRRLAALCRERHLAWVDPEDLRDADVERLYSDALHFDAAAHARLARIVASSLLS